MQEKRSQSGLGRRHEEIKGVSEPVKEETTSSHDDKTARAAWRKYAIHVLISISESLLLIPSVILDLLPRVPETSGFGSKIRKGAVKILHSYKWRQLNFYSRNYRCKEIQFFARYILLQRLKEPQKNLGERCAQYSSAANYLLYLIQSFVCNSLA